MLMERVVRVRNVAALLTAILLGCSEGEELRSDEVAGGGGASAGGSAPASGASGQGGAVLGGAAGAAVGDAAGAPEGGAGSLGGQGGAPDCLYVPDGSCTEAPSCCPVRGARYELPLELSCIRLAVPEVGTVDCYTLEGGGGCGGGLALNWCQEKRTSEGWVRVELPQRPFGWPTDDAWGDCSQISSALALDAKTFGDLPTCP